MNITIHRPRQIGGQITEITSSKGTRIIVDLGHNLPKAEGDSDPLDNREAIERLTKGCKAVLYTHYHGDHVGLCHHVPSEVPQYIGPIARDVMRCKYERLKSVPSAEAEPLNALNALDRMKTYAADAPIWIDDIKVTPYFVSHSACDAHMFLIEADGKSILHTGDFREHSRVGSHLIEMLQKYVGSVDVLITEGTMLSRKGETVDTEEQLEEKAEALMREHKYVFIHSSSTDLERLRGFTQAFRKVRPHAPLVCDGYQFDVLKVFQNIEYKGKKKYNFGRTIIYDGKETPNLQRRREEMREEGFVMLVRVSADSKKFLHFLDDILPMLDPTQTLFIYSMWSGYVDPHRKDTLKPSYVELQDRFRSPSFSTTICTLHTSGHATMETLRKVCETLKPSTAIIPVHRDADSDFGAIGLSEELNKKVVTENIFIDDVEVKFID